MHKDEQTEAAKDHDGTAATIRDVSEVVNPGREPVVVRTTRLAGPDPERERRVRAGLRRLPHEGRSGLHRLTVSA